MTRMIMFIGLVCSGCVLTCLGIRRDSSEGSEGMGKNQNGEEEFRNASPSARELENFQLVKDLRKQGFKCPSGKYYKGIPDTETTFKFDCRLWRASQLWSKEMGNGNFFDHDRGGSTPFKRAKAQGFKGALGENIAGGGSTAKLALAQWKKSDGHCRNMMNPKYNSFGVGYALTPRSKYKHYWTQMLGKASSVDQSCLQGTPPPLPTSNSGNGGNSGSGSGSGPGGNGGGNGGNGGGSGGSSGSSGGNGGGSGGSNGGNGFWSWGRRRRPNGGNGGGSGGSNGGNGLWKWNWGLR
eukprot:TRINITY_DN7773_c0_g1_i1.p1 TRINITY_DN7773_c0_g1~~TRINITY_DN7773_c0_g1_i1.p1  ORF type:complete len:295 (+),score=39.04 TRINITY_DN7773_c0_g1_i1:62-946(+)